MYLKNVKHTFHNRTARNEMKNAFANCANLGGSSQFTPIGRSTKHR